MATTIPSAALVPIAPVFTNTERLALAGFLAGYSGLTRQAYELDLRQFASWCQQHQLHLFGARRADIECFARDLEARGRARATVTRRLCTVAGFYRYAVEEELLDHSPAAHVRRPRLDYESHATGLDRNELGALLVAAGLGRRGACADLAARAERAAGLRGHRRGHRSPASSAATAPCDTARAARWSPSRSRRAPPGRSTWRSVNAAKAPSSSAPTAIGSTGTAPGGSSAGSPAGRDHQARRAPHAAPCVHHRRAGCWRPAAGCPGSRFPRRPAHHHAL